MNTNSLKKFATQARSLLMQGVRSRLRAVGFNEDGSVRETPKQTENSAIFDGQVINDSHFVARWESLRSRITNHGVKQVVEESAYTWFNRLVAIRILERNGLAPALLDYSNADIRLPRIVTDARAGKTPILSDEDRVSLLCVIGDGRLAFEQFAILIRAYCENNPIISKCFGGITDYTALLLPADILAEGNFIDLLNDADCFISGEDWTKPELIGWLYQFYISDKKDEVFAKKGGYESDEIPAATQIFTPNWIVKYMVENTIGRLWADQEIKNKNEEIRNNPAEIRKRYEEIKERMNWKYLIVPESEFINSDFLFLNSTNQPLEELKCADLSCGSGHILNEMFDLLMQLYAEDFYSPREAIEVIFTKNMVGIDLDIRARQLAQFALLLKACQTDRSFIDGHCMPRIYSFPDVDVYTWRDLSGHFTCAYDLDSVSDNVNKELDDAFKLMKDADTLGSIMKFDISDETRKFLNESVKVFDREPKFTESFTPLIDSFRIILALTEKYAAICMNPPYMPTNKEARLKEYVTANYPDTKADLFAVFMDVATDRLETHGKYGMINMQSWMFLSSFESLRYRIIEEQQIDSLLHLGPRTFDELSGEVVQNAAFVITNERASYPGIYCRLIDGKNCTAKRDEFLIGDNRYIIPDQKQFEQIPGAPIAYWVSEKIRETFTNNLPLSAVCKPTQGLATADNGRFVRSWFEVAVTSIGFGCESASASVASGRKFFPYNKGGATRKWYGNQELVVNWENDGYEIKNFKGAVVRNPTYYFKPSIAWSLTSSIGNAFRYFPQGFIFDVNGMSLFTDNIGMLCYLNSNLCQRLLNIINPTLACQVGNVAVLPYLSLRDKVYETAMAEECISISKQDWDAHETSWDFQTNPLLAVDTETYINNIEWEIEKHRRATGETILIDPTAPQLESLRWRYEQYCQKWESLFDRLHRNEEELNRKFIDIYGLQDELTSDVPLKDVTILQQGEIKIIDEAAIELENGGHLLTEDGKTLTVGIEPEIEWQTDVIMKQFVSYAIGCMMGRYRLDRPGLSIAHTGPYTEQELAPYEIKNKNEELRNGDTADKDFLICNSDFLISEPQTRTWWIDDDGIIPMMGEDSTFPDEAHIRFREFLIATLGEDNITDNMNFVRETLGKDVVDYLRNDFYADHKKMYQNRPIYWMFSSNQKGKRAAFQCLAYMHRMNRFTPEHIRTNYLLPYIDRLAAIEADLLSKKSLSAKENKRLKQVRSDLEECRDYQLRLHNFADQQIELDLDDGVVKNYATFASVLAKLK